MILLQEQRVARIICSFIIMSKLDMIRLCFRKIDFQPEANLCYFNNLALAYCGHADVKDNLWGDFIVHRWFSLDCGDRDNVVTTFKVSSSETNKQVF